MSDKKAYKPPNLTKAPRTLAAVQNDVLALTRFWTWIEDVPKSQQILAKEFGGELHKIGGIQAMRETYYLARERNKAANVLQYYWDGVGTWRA